MEFLHSYKNGYRPIFSHSKLIFQSSDGNCSDSSSGIESPLQYAYHLTFLQSSLTFTATIIWLLSVTPTNIKWMTVERMFFCLIFKC